MNKLNKKKNYKFYLNFYYSKIVFFKITKQHKHKYVKLETIFNLLDKYQITQKSN